MKDYSCTGPKTIIRFWDDEDWLRENWPVGYQTEFTYWGDDILVSGPSLVKYDIYVGTIIGYGDVNEYGEVEALVQLNPTPIGRRE